MFITSYQELHQLPDLQRRSPIFCFFGRSNVGKSTLINALFGFMARTSKTPGKTRALNLFKKDNFYILDLPGFGYSVRSKKEQKQWTDLILNALENLHEATLIFIQDAVNPHQKSDQLFYEFIQSSGHKKILVFNKIDQLKTQKERAQFQKNLLVMSSFYKKIPLIFTVSGKNKDIDQLKDHLLKQS